MIEVDDYFECASHSDDVTYDVASKCGIFDKYLCDGTNTEHNLQFPVSCDDLDWCQYFCGNECNDGTGGICMLNLVSNMRTTCEAVSTRVEKLYGDPSYNDNPLHHELSLSSSNISPSNSDGCGNYVLCGWCKGDCLISVVQEYFFNVFDEEIPSDVPAISPAPNVKYSLFVQPLDLCDTFGMLSSKAKLFKGMKPGEGKSLISSSSSSSSWLFRDPGTTARITSVMIMLPAIVVTIMLIVRYLFRMGLDKRAHGSQYDFRLHGVESENLTDTFSYSGDRRETKNSGYMTYTQNH